MSWPSTASFVAAARRSALLRAAPLLARASSSAAAPPAPGGAAQSARSAPGGSSPPAAAGAPPPPRRAPRLTGFQKSVLALYRDCLAAARRLPTRAAAAGAAAYVRAEFRAKAASVDKLDIQRIEFLTRQARRKLETYTAAGVDAVGLSFTAGEGAARGGAR